MNARADIQHLERLAEAVVIVDELKRNAEALLLKHQAAKARLADARRLVDQSRRAGLTNVDVAELARALGMQP
jgi:hypothetical protein